MLFSGVCLCVVFVFCVCFDVEMVVLWLGDDDEDVMMNVVMYVMMNVMMNVVFLDVDVCVFVFGEVLCLM